MLTDETTVGDGTILDPLSIVKKREKTTKIPPVVREQDFVDFPFYVNIIRGIARYGNTICLDNINLQVCFTKNKFNNFHIMKLF